MRLNTEGREAVLQIKPCSSLRLLLTDWTELWTTQLENKFGLWCPSKCMDFPLCYLRHKICGFQIHRKEKKRTQKVRVVMRSLAFHTHNEDFMLNSLFPLKEVSLQKGSVWLDWRKGVTKTYNIQVINVKTNSTYQEWWRNSSWSYYPRSNWDPGLLRKDGKYNLLWVTGSSQGLKWLQGRKWRWWQPHPWWLSSFWQDTHIPC